MVAYLIRHERCEIDQAIKLIKEKRPEIHIETEQLQVLEKFRKELK